MARSAIDWPVSSGCKGDARKYLSIWGFDGGKRSGGCCSSSSAAYKTYEYTDNGEKQPFSM